MNVGDIALVAWSGAAAFWWVIAVGLVQAARRPPPGIASRDGAAAPTLTVFKPLPWVPDLEARDALACAVTSFVLQLEDSMELVVGVPAEQAGLWSEALATWSRQIPGDRIRSVVRATPRHRANPKVAWLEVLAPVAGGAWWLWSDADVTAPPCLLAGLRQELEAAPEAGAVTAPYCIRKAPRPAGWFDALFVNMEFLPGTLLLARTGPVPLAFGAAVLFRAADFRSRMSWEELGASLADDHELGRGLAPVLVSRRVAETCALETRLGPALRHVYRWQKTIRWCRPGGFAALVLILPLLGWAFRCAMAPADPVAWSGLGLQYLLECGVALALLNRVGFRGPSAGWAAVVAWPALRAIVWLAAWLPIPVTWGDAPAWEQPRMKDSPGGPGGVAGTSHRAPGRGSER